MNPIAAVETPLGRLFEALLLEGGFNTSVVVIGTSLFGVAGGIVGTFTLLRRRALLADAVAHATLPGVAGAFLVAAALGASGRSLPLLLAGAAVGGAAAILLVALLSRLGRFAEETAIGIALSTLFGVGIVLLSVVQRLPGGESAGLSRFIFGQAATMLPSDVAAIAATALLAIALALLCFKELRLLCFDEAFATVSGLPVRWLDRVLLGLVVLVVVAGLSAVGMLLVIALLVIPPAAARFWSDRWSRLLPVAGGIGALCGWVGSAASAAWPNLPAGPVIVLASGGVFLASALLAPQRGVLAAGWRRLRLRVRIGEDHLLRLLAVRPEEGVESSRLQRARGWSSAGLRLLLWWGRLRGLLRIDRTRAIATARGLDRGRAVLRNHRLWEAYLVRFAAVAPSHVDWSAERIEHVLSPELVADLERALVEEGAIP